MKNIRRKTMNNLWNKQVQSTELLYYSRLESFNEITKNTFFKLLQVKEGMKILEVGCGGGTFCNIIKQNFPTCKVYGIDLDTDHIEFAKKKAKELKVDVNYSVADINKLPFKNGEFDLVYSHTVVEHLPFKNFIKEQKRVLKKGGKLIIMRVLMEEKNNADQPFLICEDEVNACYNKMEFEPQPISMAKYLESPNLTMQHLEEHGFKKINVSFDRIVYYNPDCAKSDIAKEQIRRNYETKLYYALFNLQKAKNGENLRAELLQLLEKQYKERLKLLEQNKKIFDFQSTKKITISAVKK
jgi:ubiquinone/menaquinone biosynthesis C-methylase UbiE